MSISAALSPIRTIAIFERKVGLTPKDLNKIGKTTIDDLLLEKIRGETESKCSQHGWVIPGSTRILSRSMCQNESGRFTGMMVSWVQIESSVYFPTDGMQVIGEVLKKNKMGMFVTYENAIQIMVPRDLHLGESFDDYEAVKIGDYIQVEIKKSRFQINDPYILSVGEFQGVVEKPDTAAVPAFRDVIEAPAAAAAASPVPVAAGDTLVETDEENAEEGAEEEYEPGALPAAAAAPAAAAPAAVQRPVASVASIATAAAAKKGPTVASFL
jgi:DNA-directed RNA polymerase subunit E'/Rpb7